MDVPTHATDTPGAIALDIQGLHKTLGGAQVLKGISLQARSHEVTAILGRSGSGKSTLLRCINLLEIPDEGEIHVAGERIRMGARGEGGPQGLDARQVLRLRRKVAMVFQQFNLWSHMTVLQNVMFAPVKVLGLDKPQAQERAMLHLERVGLAHRGDAYPATLSGGQQQRVAIARALAMDPEVILFDEPTSALDPELVGEVQSVMRSLAEEGRTMLVVTHEMGFARDIAHQVVFLHQGLVEEVGTSAELFGEPRSPHLARFLSSSPV